MADFTIHCPKCGSEDIREKNVAYAELSVFEWRLDDDIPVPEDYDTDASADWECEDVWDQYVCHGDGCGWSGSCDQLEVRRVSPGRTEGEGTDNG